MFRFLDKIRRLVATIVAVPIILLMVPFKIWAFRTRIRLLKRTILEVTAFFDWLITLANVQNRALLLYFRIFRGNFVFGRAIMEVSHRVASEAIALPTLRGNRFMGIDIVTNDPAAFCSNAGPITNSQPVRRLQRKYIDEEIMTENVRGLNASSLRTHCDEIIDEWQADPQMANWLSIRGAATRLYFRILTDKILPKEAVDDITFQYVRRFAEFSVFGRYLPAMLWILGTREGIRRDVYIRLRKYDLDNVAIDMTLFAAMFSVGTIVMTAVELCGRYQIAYQSLTLHQKMQFVMEAQRLHPTVTSVHRIVEEPETVEVLGWRLKLEPGDEVHYPFVCINRDNDQFGQPEVFDLNRSPEEMMRILSWSVGPHVCPAKDLSILSVVLMLDALSERYELRELKIFNPEF